MGESQRQGHAAEMSPASRTARQGLSISITPATIWYATGVALTLIVVWLLFTKALAALLIFFIAVIIGEAARPLVLRLERRHVPRPLGVLLVLLVVAVALGLLAWLLLSPLVAEVGALSANAPTYLRRLQEWITSSSAVLHANKQVGSFFDGLVAQSLKSLQTYAPSLVSVPFTILSGAFGGLLSLVLTLTITIFWLSSSANLKAFTLSLFSERLRPNVEMIVADMGRSLGGYVRGVLIAMLLIGIFTGLGLGVLGVPYALLLGALAGLTESIPYVGPWISGTVAALVALVTVDPLKALEVVLLFLVVQQLEGNLVQPLVMSRSVRLDPLLVLIAILVGSEMLGLIGAVLAVPFTALLQSLVTYALAPAIRHAVGAKDIPPPDSTGDAAHAEASSPA